MEGGPAKTAFDLDRYAPSPARPPRRLRSWTVGRPGAMGLGSRQGNAHLHWHLAPLPPGVPYDQQQFSALMAENGVLAVDDAAQSALAREIRTRLRLPG